MSALCSGVPLLPLYMRGAGLQGRFPSRLRVGILAGYNCISRYTRKIGSYPYSAGSFLQSCVANSPNENRLCLIGLAHPVRASTLWASSWVSRGNIPHKVQRQVYFISEVLSESKIRYPHVQKILYV